MYIIVGAALLFAAVTVLFVPRGQSTQGQSLAFPNDENGDALRRIGSFGPPSPITSQSNNGFFSCSRRCSGRLGSFQLRDSVGTSISRPSSSTCVGDIVSMHSRVR